jgi:hypothetical protein
MGGVVISRNAGKPSHRYAAVCQPENISLNSVTAKVSGRFKVMSNNGVRSSGLFSSNISLTTNLQGMFK